MTTKRRRTLPPVSPKVSAELRPLVSAIAEIIETGEGVRGDPLDRKLTLRDLLDSGIGRLRNGLPPSNPGALQPGTGAPDLSTPPKPVGFEAVAAFDGEVFLTWETPQRLYSNHALTNIYRAESDNFANAERIGQEPGMFYIDNVRADASQKTYYYWISFTSTSEVEGPVNDTSGTPVTTILSPEYIIDKINGLISKSELANDVLAPIESIPSIQQTLNNHGIRIPSLEDTVGNHAIQIPSMQSLLDDYGPRILAAEGTVVDHSNEITNLHASLSTAQGDIVANADAYASLDTRVTASETEIATQAGQIVSLQSSLNDLTIPAFEPATAYAIGELFRYDNVVYEVVAAQSQPNATPPNVTYYSPRPDYETIADTVSANSAAVSALDTRVTAAEDTITAQATDITLLQSELDQAEGDILANANAASSLATRVTGAEAGISSLSGSITTLQNSLASTDGSVASNADAISSLQTEVANLDGVITSQSADITQLQNALNSAELDIAANASAYSALETRVASAEGTITSQGSDITSLSNSLSLAQGGISANSDALALIDTRVSNAEGAITSQGNAITQLESDVTQAENGISGNASAINSLNTRVTFAEGSLSSVAQDVSQLQVSVGDNSAAIQTKAEVSAVQGIEDDVAVLSAQYTVKLDVNDRVAGIGLANDNGVTSFVVASDSVYFIDPGQSITAFNPNTNYASMAALRNTQFVFGYATVEGQRRFAINVPAYIPDATITNAMIKDAVITGAKIKDATINGAKIDIADIWELNIADVIRSANYLTGVRGWQVTKSGSAEFSDVTVRGHVEMETGYISDQVQIGGVPQYSNFRPGNFLRNGAGVSASSPVSDLNYLTDGIRSISGNYWQLDSGSGPQYLQADIGFETFVSESRMFFYALDGRRYRTAVSVSLDGVTWEYVLGSGPANGDPATAFVWSRSPTGGYLSGYEFPTIVPVGKFARYVRVWMNGNTVNTGNHGYEWELYGAGGGGEDPYTASIGSTTEDWVRPGTTLINGNKIFTGDAYVDTLQIKGQAVTFPRGVSAAGNIALPQSIYGTVLTLTMSTSGAPLIINASLGITKGVTGPDSEGLMRLLVNGVEVVPPLTLGGVYTIRVYDGPTYSRLNVAGACTRHLASTVKGTTTIQLQAYVSSGGGFAYARSITALEAKR